MVAIIVVGLNVMTWALSLQNNFGQVITERNIVETEQSSEKVEMRDFRIDNDKFNMTLANTGGLPVKLVQAWFTNTTDTNGWHKNYTMSKLINPGDSLTKFGYDLNLIAKNSSSYKISAITERGSIANFQILSPKDKAMMMHLFAIPRSVATGHNVTIMFGVTNNLTDGSIVQSIRPKPPTLTYTETPGGSKQATATLIEGPKPAFEQSLTLGETIFFKWVYKIEGDPKDKITFDVTIYNAKQGNNVVETIEVADLATGSTIVTQITTVSGILTMNFTSFEFCEDLTGTTCQSNSANWQAGWKIVKNKNYYWRVNLTNNGDRTIFFDKQTSLFLLHVQEGGGGSLPYDIYIMTDATTTADPGAYTTNGSSKLLADGKPYTVYFGGATVSSGTTQSLGNVVGMFAVSTMIFGYFDENSDNNYQAATDTDPYSQNIPFQALLVE